MWIGRLIRGRLWFEREKGGGLVRENVERASDE
jgi:hypothetical protein